MKRFIKQCLQCGLSFDDRTINHNKIYCSVICLMRHKRDTDPKYKEYDRQYFQNHKKEIQIKRSKRHRERYNSDPLYRLKDMLRSRLLKAIKKNIKTGSAIKDLGCSINEFKAYFESKFLPGMTWDNFGKGKDRWNLDHIVPLFSFNLFDPEQLKKACHFTNLQPIWEVQHYIKTRNDLRKE